MTDALIIDGVRTPFGRHGGGLAPVRPDDLAAHVIRDAAGAHRRTRRRRRGRACSAAPTRPARTTATSRAWRRCSPGCRSRSAASPSTGCAARAWTRSRRPRARSGSARRGAYVAGGVESMSRAPFVVPKPVARVPDRARRDGRHDARLAARQPAHGGAGPHRLARPDGGEPRRRARHHARPSRTASRSPATPRRSPRPTPAASTRSWSPSTSPAARRP